MMDLSNKAHRLQKFKDVGMFIWKYGHVEFIKSAGLQEWLSDYGFSDNGHGNGNGNGNGKPLLAFEDVASTHVDFKETEFVADVRNLGPTYVRIAQILSKRPDILPGPLIEFLSKVDLQDEPLGIIELDSAVRNELGIPVAEIFPTFNEIPLTVSPFDQTHFAQLKDGRKVIVKIQKPGLRERVYSDLATLGELVDFCDHHTKTARRISLRSIVDELRKLILAELDYRQEANNLVHLTEALQGLEHIVVPSPVHRFSTSRLLTMNYIEGNKLPAASQTGLLAAERTALAGEVFHAYMKQILVDGFVHGDPNPENILLTKSGKLALLDLGVVTRVTAAMQEKLLQIILAINEGRAEQVAESIINISNKRENFDEAAFRRIVEEIVLMHRDMPSDHLEIGRVFIRIAQASLRYGISLPSELGTLGTTLINLDKIADMLDKNFDSRKFLEQNITDIMRGHVMRTFTAAHFFQNMLEAFELLEKMPGKVGRILDAVANNELKVTVDAIDENVLMSGFQKIANRITMGLVLAALIMGASQLMQIKTTFTIWGYPGVAIICFIAAAVFSFGLVLEILIGDRRKQ